MTIAPLATPSRNAGRLVALVAATFLAAGCAPALHSERGPAATAVPELFESPALPAENLDSLAYWEGGGWIIATAKSTHRLWVFAAADGRVVRSVGEEGDGFGQFRRPNGVAVVGDVLLVTERDNHRVHVLRLPDFAPLGLVGVGTLKAPYGIAAFADAGGLEVYVTDNYLAPDGTVPSAAALGERVRHFRLQLRDGGATGELVRSFGDTSGNGVLHVVESIAADPERNRLLIADEAEGARDIKVYDLAGHFTGTVLGSGAFAAEPEGLALVRHGVGGFWIATDQRKDRTHFLLFDRVSLQFLGSFTGASVANTDGVAVVTGDLGGRGAGGLVAVNSDVSVAAFSLLEIQKAIRGAAACGCASGSAPCRAVGRNWNG